MILNMMRCRSVGRSQRFVHVVTELFNAAAVVSACVRLCFFALLTQPIFLGVCVFEREVGAFALRTGESVSECFFLFSGEIDFAAVCRT